MIPADGRGLSFGAGTVPPQPLFARSGGPRGGETLQMGKAQHGRGCDRWWGESAVQEHGCWEQAAAAACVAAPGGGTGHPPKLLVCRGHCSALRVAWTFPPPELRASQ